MIFPTNKTLTAVYGQPLTLSMEFCANPPYSKAFWIVKNKMYSPGEEDNKILAYAITVSIYNLFWYKFYIFSLSKAEEC